VTPLILALALSVPNPDGESVDARAQVERLDRATRRAKDLTTTIDVTVRRPGGSEVTRQLRVWQLGSEHRMVRVLAPARLRGTAILVRGERVHIYLPGYPRVREVTGRKGGQMFAGTELSVDELAMRPLGNTHVAALDKEVDGNIVLVLTPQGATDYDYAAMRVHMRKQDDLAAMVEYLDTSGAIYRTVSMSDFRTVGAYTTAHQMVVDDEKSARRTLARLKDVVFDSGLDEEFFSQRQLQRMP
jgi:hypothetical protein